MVRLIRERFLKETRMFLKHSQFYAMEHMIRIFFCWLPLVCVFDISAKPESNLYASLESRVRYESLNGQYRKYFSGSDQLVATRNLALLGIEVNDLGSVLELHDARAYLDDDGTPLSGSFVNTFAVLQGYLKYSPRFLKMDNIVKVGRFTLDIGSRRFAERNDFRNTINSYSGVHWIGEVPKHRRIDVFLSSPVEKKPGAYELLRKNDFARDEEQLGRRFLGIQLQEFKIQNDLQGDLFLYGLIESDLSSYPTKDRKLWSPGIRLKRSKRMGVVDFEVELALRKGEMSCSIEDKSDSVSVAARMLHAEIGYTFDNSFSSRLGIEYDFASGDDPTTEGFERYERFYGTRRGDLGNTSIHGPLTRSNISVPGVRLSFQKGDLDGRFVLQKARLASAGDSWIVAKLQDSSGKSGKNIGTTFDFRIRKWMRDKKFRVELGGSLLRWGDFARSVNPDAHVNLTVYGYSQITAYL